MQKSELLHRQRLIYCNSYLHFWFHGFLWELWPSIWSLALHFISSTKCGFSGFAG